MAKAKNSKVKKPAASTAEKPAASTAEKPAASTAEKPVVLKMLNSTARVFGRMVGVLANLAGIQTKAKEAAEAAKAKIAETTEAAKADWKVIASEHKDKAERKELARLIHKSLQKDHGLAPQRASDMLKVLGLDGLLFAKHQKVRVEVATEIVEMLFTLADQKLDKDGTKVKTALSRAYGKAREVYRKG